MNWNQSGTGNQFGNTSMDGGGFNSPGGGFMANTTFGSPIDSQEKKSRVQRKLSMIPVTVAMLNKLTYEQVEDTCQLDGIKFHQVTLVGVITKINEMSAYMSYEIDDFTGGIIIVRKWIDKDDNPEEYKTSQFREDTLIRVYGYVKVLEGDKKTVTAFCLNRVTDFNELTYHMLSVIHSWVLLKKIANEGASAMTSPGMQFDKNTSMQGGMRGGVEETSGMNNIQNQVLEIISNSTENEGMSRDAICQKISSVPQSTTMKTIDFLSDEGHIYSTVDDDHFRATHSS